MSRSPRTRLDPEVRRELILDAAERVMVDRIPSEVTFEEIADAADVSRGLVHNYFRDRPALLLALAERAVGRLDDEVAAALEPGSAPTEQARALARAYARHSRANEGTWRLLARARLLDHPRVLASRSRRVGSVAAQWGDGPDAVLAAWVVTSLYEMAGYTPLPTPVETGDLVRFVCDTVVAGLGSPTVGAND